MKKQNKILCHLVKIYYTPYVVKMHKKKHQIRPLSRKKINTSIEFFSMWFLSNADLVLITYFQIFFVNIQDLSKK